MIEDTQNNGFISGEIQNDSFDEQKLLNHWINS